MLVVGVEPTLELPLTFLTDVDSLVQGEPHKVKGLGLNMMSGYKTMSPMLQFNHRITEKCLKNFNQH